MLTVSISSLFLWTRDNTIERVRTHTAVHITTHFTATHTPVVLIVVVVVVVGVVVLRDTQPCICHHVHHRPAICSCASWCIPSCALLLLLLLLLTTATTPAAAATTTAAATYYSYYYYLLLLSLLLLLLLLYTRLFSLIGAHASVRQPHATMPSSP